MAEPLFDIVFRGDIILGHNIQDVKQRLGQLFKADPAKIDALFTGGAVSLKRNVDAEAAEKYKAVLTKSGAQVQIRPAGGAAAKPKSTPKPVPKPTVQASAPQATPPKAAPAQGPLSQGAGKNEPEAPLVQFKSRKPVVNETVESKPLEPEGFSLAPVGSYLLEGADKKEQAPAEVDTSSISIKPMSGDLLEESEKPIAPKSVVAEANFDLAEAGSDLLKEEERKKVVPVQLDDLVFDIADVGADMIDPEDKLPLASVEVETGNFDLAPVGSDMNQEKKPPPPSPPDTSAIKLAD